MRSTIKTLEYVSDKKLIKQYAFFLQIKARFSNSCVYRKTKLHEVMGVSRSTLYRNTLIFIKHGWAHYHHGNLVLKSAEEIHERITGHTTKHFIDIQNRDQIYIQLVKNHQRRKQYVKDKVSDLKSNSKRVVKSANKFLGARKNFVSDGISSKKAAKVFGLSASQANFILLGLERKGLIRIERVRQKLGLFDAHSMTFFSSLHKGSYRMGDSIFINHPSLIHIL